MLLNELSNCGRNLPNTQEEKRWKKPAFQSFLAWKDHDCYLPGWPLTSHQGWITGLAEWVWEDESKIKCQLKSTISEERQWMQSNNHTWGDIRLVYSEVRVTESSCHLVINTYSGKKLLRSRCLPGWGLSRTLPLLPPHLIWPSHCTFTNGKLTLIICNIWGLHSLSIFTLLRETAFS